MYKLEGDSNSFYSQMGVGYCLLPVNLSWLLGKRWIGFLDYPMMTVGCFNGFNSYFFGWLLSLIAVFRILQVLIIQPVWSFLLFFGPISMKCWEWGLLEICFDFSHDKKRFALGETAIVVRYGEVFSGSMVPPFEEVEVWENYQMWSKIWFSKSFSPLLISSIAINHVLLFKIFPWIISICLYYVSPETSVLFPLWLRAEVIPLWLWVYAHSSCRRA